MAYEYSPSTDLVVNAVQITGERERDSRLRCGHMHQGPASRIPRWLERISALTDTGWQGARLSEEITLSAEMALLGLMARSLRDRHLVRPWVSTWPTSGRSLCSGTWNGPFGANEKFRLLYCTGLIPLCWAAC